VNSPVPAIADGPSAVRFGPFRLDVANRLLSRDGTELSLPPRAIGVLWCLVTRPGRIVSKQEVLDEVWKDAFVSDTSLAEAVSLVRQVLGDDPQQPTYIQTVPRRGYRFVAPLVVEEPAAGPAVGGPAAPASVSTASHRSERLWTPWLPYLLLFVAGVAIGLAFMVRARPAPAPPAGLVRFALDLPPGTVLAGGRSLAVSRDGGRFAMVVRRPGDRSALALRRLDSETIVVVPNSDGASAPAFSPDGRWVVFFAGGRLLKAPVSGGAPTVIADAPAALGATWIDAGHVVFASRWTGGLDIADLSRGGVRPLTRPDAARGELRHAWPGLVPTADIVTFSIAYGLDSGGSEAAWVSLRTGDVTRLALDSTDTRPVGDEHLLLLRPGTSAVVPVDRNWTGPTGEQVSLPDTVSVDDRDGGAAAAFSGNGVRVAVDEAEPNQDAVWIGNGADAVEVSGLRGLDDRAVSPDGAHVAAVERQSGRATLWAIDLVSGVRARVAVASRIASPVWAPDSRTLAVGISNGGPLALATVSVDQPAPARTLATDPRGLLPCSWEPDGSRLLAIQASADRGWDIVNVLAAGGPVAPLISTPADEVGAAVAPDGTKLAYLSNASGDWTLFVRPIAGEGPALAVAPDVRAVAWADASTLIYLTGDRVLSVPLSVGRDRIEAGRPQSVAIGVVGVARGTGPNGRLLATLRRHAANRPHVVLGWLDALRAYLAANAPMPRSFR
jgi:serine/threonine-protein kinase